MSKKKKKASKMAVAEVVTKPISEMTSEEKIDAICPTCGVPVATHKCRLCGATKSINQASGNQIWMRNGRLVAAFKDSRTAYIKMALSYNIPRDQWPEEFRTSPVPVEG